MVCQKSKIKDWEQHFLDHYDYNVIVYKKECVKALPPKTVIIINYDSLWRRKELSQLKNFSLVLDESQYIKNGSSNRTKFVMKMKPSSVILLSGTPVGGKYEELYTQLKLLGWDITKQRFYDNYILTKEFKLNGFPIKRVTGYKNVARLKRKLREYGAIFLESDAVLSLPTMNHYPINIPNIRDYKTFQKDSFLEKGDLLLLGDTALNKMLGSRKLCSTYNHHKIEKVKELIESTHDRLIIFYNFQLECDLLHKLCGERPVSFVNGQKNDLSNYHDHNDSITLIQYQSGASGLNLQKCNKTIYFTLPLSSELFEQSKKRTNRIGQDKPCFYYYLIVENSIEEKIYKTLLERKDYTSILFSE